jgi:hypothetical protein
MAVVIWGVDRWVLFDQALWLRILVDVITGIFVYAFLIHAFRLKAWDDIRELMLEAAA